MAQKSDKDGGVGGGDRETERQKQTHRKLRFGEKEGKKRRSNHGKRSFQFQTPQGMNVKTRAPTQNTHSQTQRELYRY